MQYVKSSAGKAVGKRELIQALHLKTADERAALRKALRRLEQQGNLFRLRGNHWILPDLRRRLTGRLRIHPHRFGFVTPDAGGEDVFIPEEALSVALDGDRVLVEVVRRNAAPLSRRGRFSSSVGTVKYGRIIRVLERHRTRVVGRLCKTQWYCYVIPDSPRIPHTIRIDEDEARHLCEEHKVWVKLNEWSSPSAPLTGTVIEDLGPADQRGADVLSVMRDHGIEADFPTDAQEEARDAKKRFRIGDALHGRTDLRQTLTFTIDPAEAKDFDDAVSLEITHHGTVKLGVHIADVAYFVRPNTALDREAYLRGNSVYLVDRAIPMLPPELSCDLCSLQPGEDRLTHTVEIEFDAHGQVTSYRTFPSIIRSRARLTYDQVQRYLEGSVEPDLSPSIQNSLQAMRELAAKLRERRMAAGSLDLWMPEVRCILDEAGVPVALMRRGADEAYNLIEEFMLAANRVVAEILARAELPAVYRVHPPPDKFQWAWMLEELKELDISLASCSRDALNQVARRFAKTDKSHIVHLAILRNLKRAHYSPTLSEHFGLAFSHYTHFTSPIRRYPDLVVHRLLHSIEQGLPCPLTHEDAARIAEHCSWTERNADDAEQESLDVKRFEYFARLLRAGDIGPFHGVVINVTPRGPIIELTDSLQRGLLPFRSVDHDYYLLNDSRTSALGRRGRRVWKIGQPVKVILARVDRARRQVDFALEHAHSARTSGRAKLAPGR